MARRTSKSSRGKSRSSGSLQRRTRETSKNRPDSSGKGFLNLTDYDDVSFFKPEVGRSEIEILPFKINEDWYPELRSPRGQPIRIETGEEDYKLEVPIHQRIGAEEKPYLCLQLAFGKRCPICEERKAADDVDIAEALRPKWREFYNVLDRNEEDKGVQIFGVSEYLFERELLDEAEQSEEVVTFSDPDEGKTIRFRASKKSIGKQSFLEFKSFSFEDRDEPISDELLESVFPLDSMVDILDYETLQAIFLGTEADDDDDDDVPDTTRKTRQQHGKPEEDPEEDQEDDNKDWNGVSCPFGGEFGTDCAKLEVCDEQCPEAVFDACSVEMESIEDAKVKAKKEKVEKPKRKRTRK